MRDHNFNYKVRVVVQPIVVALFPVWLREAAMWWTDASSFHKLDRVDISVTKPRQKLQRIWSAAAAEAWLTNMTVDLNCTVKSATVLMFGAQSATGQQVKSDTMFPTVEIQLGRFEVYGDNSDKPSEVLQGDERSDIYVISLSGFGIKVGSHTQTMKQSFKANIGNQVFGPLTISFNIFTSSVRAKLPAVCARTQIRGQVWCPKICIDIKDFRDALSVLKGINQAVYEGLSVRSNDALGIVGDSKHSSSEKVTNDSGKKGHGIDPDKSQPAENDDLLFVQKQQRRMQARSKLQIVHFEMLLVDALCIELSECDKLLIALVAKDLSISAIVRSQSFDMEIKLVNLEIEDFILQNYTRRHQQMLNYMLVCMGPSKFQKVSSTADIVEYCFFRTSISIVETQTSVSDWNADVCFGQTQVVICLHTIATLMSWFDNATSTDGFGLHNVSESGGALKSKCTKKSQGWEIFSESRTNVSFSALHIRFIQDSAGHTLESINIDVLSGKIFLALSNTLSVEFSMHSFTIADSVEFGESFCRNRVFMNSVNEQSANSLTVLYEANRTTNSQHLSADILNIGIKLDPLFVEKVLAYIEKLRIIMKSDRDSALGGSTPQELQEKHFQQNVPILRKFVSFGGKMHSCEIQMQSSEGGRQHCAGLIFRVCEAVLRPDENIICKCYSNIKIQLLIKRYCEMESEIASVCAFISLAQEVPLASHRFEVLCWISVDSVAIKLTDQDLKTVIQTVHLLSGRNKSIQRRQTAGFDDLQHHSPADYALHKLCIRFDVESLQICFKKHPLATYGGKEYFSLSESGELRLVLQHLKGNIHQCFTDGTNEIKLTLGTFAMDFVTAKQHCFKNIIVSHIQI